MDTITTSSPDVLVCVGRGSRLGEHCCYVDGVECEFLEQNVDGRRFSCSLRRTLGSWDAVVVDLRYVNGPGAVWVSIGAPVDYCRIWQPSAGDCCREAR